MTTSGIGDRRRCLTPDCGRLLRPEGMVMCGRHWQLLPWRLRHRLTAAWGHGQPNLDFAVALDEAIATVSNPNNPRRKTA